MVYSTNVLRMLKKFDTQEIEKEKNKSKHD